MIRRLLCILFGWTTLTHEYRYVKFIRTTEEYIKNLWGDLEPVKVCKHCGKVKK